LTFVLDKGVKHSIEVAKILSEVLPKPEPEEESPPSPPPETDPRDHE
jgi:ribosome-binding factor A